MKKWYLSRTVWLGVLTVAAAGVTASISGLGWKEVAGACIGTAIVVLRSVTTTKLGK